MIPLLGTVRKTLHDFLSIQNFLQQELLTYIGRSELWFCKRGTIVNELKH